MEDNRRYIKCGLLMFWLITGTLLFAFLHVYYPYLFYFKEQSQLFLVDSEWFYNKLFTLGGLSEWISEFLVQFFIYPYVGPFITSVLLTLSALLTGGIISRITRFPLFSISGWLPVIAQYWALVDANSYYQSLVVFFLLIFFTYIYVCLEKEKVRLRFGLILSVLLCWFTGPGAVFFALAVLMYEAFNLEGRKWRGCLPLFIVCVLSLFLFYTNQIPGMRFAFLPDAYYHKLLHPKAVFYCSWIGFLLILVLSLMIRSRNWAALGKKVQAFMVLALLFLIGGWAYWGFRHWGERNMARFMELDYYSRTGQWQKIQENCKGKLTNFLFMNMLSRSLAEQGKLTDHLMDYQIRGPQGLFVKWNKTEDVSVLLSDVCFTAGNIALSQRFAFEASSCSRGNYNVRMLQRLVQTNLIFGAYNVAEKYIGLLEHSWTYREWARKHRKFLNDDNVVESDPLLGQKRMLLLSPGDTSNIMVVGTDLFPTMELPVAANPGKSQTAFQYMVAALLLQKNIASFKMMIDTYLGTPLLPTLPVLYQEALIVALESQPEQLEKYALNPDVKNRYLQFRKQILSGRNKVGLANMMYRSFGSTYWYYMLFR